jgi:hypothetical protein
MTKGRNDRGRDESSLIAPPGPGRALLSASVSYLRKSLAGRPDAILFWRLSGAADNNSYLDRKHVSVRRGELPFSD